VPFGIGGWFHSAKSTAHIINQTVSTVRSAYALKDVFEAIAAAEKSGLSDEKKKELEDKAAQMVSHLLSLDSLSDYQARPLTVPPLVPPPATDCRASTRCSRSVSSRAPSLSNAPACSPWLTS